MSADDAVRTSVEPIKTNDQQAQAALERVQGGAGAPADLQYLLAHGSALQLGERYEDGAVLYRALAGLFPDRPRVLAGLTRCEAALGDGDAARAALAKGRQCGLPIEVANQLEGLIPGEGRDWAAARAEAEAAIAAGASDAAAYNALARACFGVGDGRAGIAAVDQARAAGGADVEVLERAARLSDATNDTERALAFFGELIRLEPGRPRWILNSARVLQRAGRTAEAEGMLEALYRNDVPPDAALKRPPVRDNLQQDLAVARGSSGTTVLVFMGLADQLVMPIPVFDRYLAEHGHSAIYVRDHKRLLYLAGIASLAADYAGTLEKLRALLGELNTKRLVTVGNSGGGVGAIAYGCDLGAEQIIGFGSPTTAIGRLRQLDYRARSFMDRFYRMVPQEQRDIEARLRRPDRKPKVDLVYGETMPEDLAHAQVAAGLPGVTLRPITGFGGHGSLLRMAQDGKLRALITELTT